VGVNEDNSYNIKINCERTDSHPLHFSVSVLNIISLPLLSVRMGSCGMDSSGPG
jgi:hypothetical protein